MNKSNIRTKPGELLILLISFVLAALFLNSCAPVGPHYVKVEPKVPKKWHVPQDKLFKYKMTSPVELAHWWTVFNDPELTHLEEKSVKGNLDLKIALARVQEARALRGIKEANLFPTLNTSASILDQRSSENAGQGRENRFYSAGFDSAWEIDIFGRTRRSIEAAQANLEATQAQLHDVLVSLFAETAINYIEVRTYQNRLKILEKNIQIQKNLYEYNKSLNDSGIISELPVKQSLYLLEQTRSMVHPIKSELSYAKNRLAVLIGENPGSVDKELASTGNIPSPPSTIALSIPMDTLRNRPDIRSAERALAYETALIGVTKADLYPTFSLNGTFGLNSIDIGSILKWGSRTWSIGPGLFWNIFNYGATKKSILMQTARQKQALLNYQSAVLKALEEVENAMVTYSKELKHKQDLERAATAAKEVLFIASDNYKAGIGTYIDVLDAEKSLQSIEDQLTISTGAISSDLIRLYKALGGGWQSVKVGTRHKAIKQAKSNKKK